MYNKIMVLSVIIVSYNTQAVLAECLSFLEQRLAEVFLPEEREIIVVDNHSTDGTREFLNQKSGITQIFLEKNIGFGSANNVGAKLAQGKYLLFLNSDVYLKEKIDFRQLTDFLAGVKAGLTVKVLLDNESLDWASHRGFPTPWASLTYFTGLEKFFGKGRFAKYFGQYHLRGENLETIHEVDALTAAFFLLKKNIFEEVNGFDEDYFMYGEDLDLCYRLKQRGYTLWYYPKYKVWHLKNKSGFKSKDLVLAKTVRVSFYDTMELFYQKHYQAKYNPAVNLLVKLGIKFIKKIKS